MEWNYIGEKRLSFSYVELRAVFLGTDLLLCLEGGDRPHIGCTVLAQPRPSLKRDGSVSATASVLNLPGHKDEALCRFLAEELCRKLQVPVVCTGGFHVDGIQKEQIDEVMEAVHTLAAEAVCGLVPAAEQIPEPEGGGNRPES